MKITIQKTDDQLIARLEGELDTLAATQAQNDLKPLFDARDSSLKLDCTDLKYISSSGLRLFLSLLKAAKANGSQLALTGLNSDITGVFKLTGFDTLFTII